MSPPPALSLDQRGNVLLGSERLIPTSIAVAPDGDFVLAALYLDHPGAALIGRSSPSGEERWSHRVELAGGFRSLDVAAAEDGTVYVAGVRPEWSDPAEANLERYSADGTRLWGHDIIGCDTRGLEAAAGTVTYGETPCRFGTVTISRLDDAGRTVFQVGAAKLGLSPSTRLVTQAGELLVAGWDAQAQGPGWTHVDSAGQVISHGAVTNVLGRITPLGLGTDGKFTARLSYTSGAGQFAGTTLSCLPGAESRCDGFLLVGDLAGNEIFATRLPWDELMGDMWSDRMRTFVLFKGWVALRTRDLAGNVLSEVPLVAWDSESAVEYGASAVAPNGDLLVAGYAAGSVTLGGEPVDAGPGRMYVLRFPR